MDYFNSIILGIVNHYSRNEKKIQMQNSTNSEHLNLSWKHQYECLLFLLGLVLGLMTGHFLALFAGKALEMIAHYS